MTPAEILERIPRARILVVGDAMHDEYVFGRVERICPEAPVPVFVPERSECRLGGAANVASQIRALGASALTAFAASWSTKTRYMAGANLVLRMDVDEYSSPGPDDVRRARNAVIGFDAVVLSDYAKGWLSYEMCGSIIEIANEHDIPVVVDPKSTEWGKYYRCSLICPNEKEHPGGARQDFDILHKQGAKGMTLYQRQSVYGRIPAVEAHIPTTARKIYDVTGAGDTVVAVVAAGLAAGSSKLEAATLAALAAGYVVGEVGTTVCSLEKLKELVNAAVAG